MMCVGNDDDVRSVAYGDNGALAGMKKGAILVDHTTASASRRARTPRESKEKGIGFVDAPVSGGQAGAVNGQLGIMCGGEQADFDRAKPVLDVYAKMCALIGAPGAGQLTKMVNQICIAGMAQGLAEASPSPRSNDLDLEKVIARDLQGRGAVLADGQPLEADERAQVRGLRLRHRMDAQGHRHLPRAGEGRAARACR